MTQRTVTVPAGSSGVPPMVTALVADGFVAVTTDWVMDANTTVTVLRSPANLNDEGKEWYLLLADWRSATTRQFGFSICEAWDDVGKTVARFVPPGTTTTTVQATTAPNADGTFPSAAVVPTRANIWWQHSQTWGLAGGIDFSLNSTPQRIYFVYSGLNFYIGTLHRTVPGNLDAFPLVICRLDAGTLSTNQSQFGGCTREPRQGQLVPGNWRVMQTATTSAGYKYLVCGLQYNSIPEGYSGTVPVPIPFLAGGHGPAFVRGVPRDARSLYNAMGAAGDTIREVIAPGVEKVYSYMGPAFFGPAD